MGADKKNFVGHASNVYGKRFVGGGMRGGSNWSEGMKESRRERGHLRPCNPIVWSSIKDTKRKRWKQSGRWRKRRGWQILCGYRVLIGSMKK